MNHPNVTMEQLPEPLPKIDEWEYRGRVESETFLHTKVLWKGHHVLSIKKHVDYPRTQVRAFDDDDDDEEPTPDTSQPKIDWMVQAAPGWEWIQYNWKGGRTESFIPTLELARSIANGAMVELFDHIRKAFMLREAQPKVSTDANTDLQQADVQTS